MMARGSLEDGQVSSIWACLQVLRPPQHVVTHCRSFQIILQQTSSLAKFALKAADERAQTAANNISS
jgi:hypothetical protein